MVWACSSIRRTWRTSEQGAGCVALPSSCVVEDLHSIARRVVLVEWFTSGSPSDDAGFPNPVYTGASCFLLSCM